LYFFVGEKEKWAERSISRGLERSQEAVIKRGKKRREAFIITLNAGKNGMFAEAGIKGKVGGGSTRKEKNQTESPSTSLLEFFGRGRKKERKGGSNK